MHRPIVYLITCSALVGCAMAQTRTAALPSPAMEMEESFGNVQAPIAVEKRERIRSGMRTGGLDYRKVERRNRSLMRSVCSDCTITPKRNLGSIGASGEAVEFPIADPAAAPDQ